MGVAKWEWGSEEETPQRGHFGKREVSRSREVHEFMTSLGSGWTRSTTVPGAEAGKENQGHKGLKC